MVASTTSSVSCGAPSSRCAITRRTLASSSIRFVCVCRRPAVSTMTTSRPRASPPRSRRRRPPRDRRRAPSRRSRRRARPAQISSCSSAAARNVSAAASSDRAPRLVQAARELADRRRLARAVDADDEDHRGRSRRAPASPPGRRPARSATTSSSAASRSASFVGLRAPRAAARSRPSPGRRTSARDQRLLDPLPALVVAGSKSELAASSAWRLVESDSRSRPNQPRRSASALGRRRPRRRGTPPRYGSRS